MAIRRLSAVLSIEREAGSRAKSVVTHAHRLSQAGTGYTGFARRYEPRNEDGDVFPPEDKRVQERVPDVLQDVVKALGSYFEASASRDYANCEAKADLVVDGHILMTGVPATYLLFLEKQLKDPLRTFVAALPTLDEAREWSYDAGSGLWKTGETRRVKTAKVETPKVVVEPTQHQPGQFHIFTTDIPVGQWVEVQHSGAIPRSRKVEMLARIDLLLGAVKEAREQANLVPAEVPQGSDAALQFIFQE